MNPPIYDRLEIYLGVAAFLLAVGIYGLLRRRTLIGMLISGEIDFLGRIAQPDGLQPLYGN